MDFGLVWDPIVTAPERASISVENLSANVTEDELRSFSRRFGEIIRVEIPPGKGHGLIEFVDHQAAELALYQMEGSPIGGSCVHLCWYSGDISKLETVPPRPPLFQFNGGTHVNSVQRWDQDLKEMDTAEEKYFNITDDAEQLDKVGLIKSFVDENKQREETIHKERLRRVMERIKWYQRR